MSCDAGLKLLIFYLHGSYAQRSACQKPGLPQLLVGLDTVSSPVTDLCHIFTSS